MNILKKKTGLGCLFLASILTTALMAATFSTDALARAGGGRSFGGRGARSFSAPARSAPSQPYQQARPQQNQPFSQPGQPMGGGGGFMRGMAGGLVGG
ncbi:Tim44 domain-containing protein, partial [Bdellovibrionota bacterium FG-2]